MSKVHTIPHTLVLLMVSWLCARGQTVMITWNGIQIWNNSLVTVSVVAPRGTTSASQHPLVCQGITGGQWYNSGLGQHNVPRKAELYRESSGVFTYGVQCCTNTTITLCVGMYSDLTFAAAVNLSALNNHSYAFFEAATYGPNITGDVQFQLLTPTNVDPPVFQLTCTSTSSPPTNVLWTINGSPVSNSSTTSSQIVTHWPTSTYNNTLTVTGRVSGNYTCTVTTTCSPVCGGFTLNPRSINSSLTIQAAPEKPVNLIVRQTGPGQARASWGAPMSGGRVSKYLIYCTGFSEEVNNTSVDLSCLQRNLQDGGCVINVTVIAMGYYLPSVGVTEVYREVISSVVIQGGGVPAIAGTSYLLTCTVIIADAVRPFNISWVNSSGQVVHQGYYSSTPSSLNLYHPAIHFSDAGNYTCRANAGLHQSYTVVNVVVQNATAPLVSITSSPNTESSVTPAKTESSFTPAKTESSVTSTVITSALKVDEHTVGVLGPGATFISSPPTEGISKSRSIPVAPIAGTIGGVVVILAVATIVVTIIVLRSQKKRKYNCHDSSFIEVNPNYVEFTVVAPAGTKEKATTAAMLHAQGTRESIGLDLGEYLYHVPSASEVMSVEEAIIPKPPNNTAKSDADDDTDATVKVQCTNEESMGLDTGDNMQHVAIASVAATEEVGSPKPHNNIYASIKDAPIQANEETLKAVYGINNESIGLDLGEYLHHASSTGVATAEEITCPKLPTCNNTSVLNNARDHTLLISVASFHEYVQSIHKSGNQQFELEYKLLQVKPGHLQTVATLACNAQKCRYANILPYDDSRVKLKENYGVLGSDFINASYIDGYKRENCYIATQGPTDNTIFDFWRMVWESRLQTIVMLTLCSEGRKSKCEMYWSDTIGGVYETDSLTVTTISIVHFADFDIRKLSVQSMVDPNAECLQVTHFQYTAWPDHGVPQFYSSILNFLRRVQKVHDKDKGIPLLVHCSAGVGRTGTFIALDILLDSMRSETSISVFDVVNDMRRRRTLMVQTLDQYMFIHDAADEYTTCRDIGISVTNLRIFINSLSRNKSGKMTNGFQEQFSLLDMLSRKPTPDECSDGAEPFNKTKNRYENILPYDISRPFLRITDTEDSDYINASFVDGYQQRKGYIATQGPLQNTVEDFWRMVWEYECRVIIMLCDLIEEGCESSYCYWPTEEGSAVSYGNISVILESTQSHDAYNARRFIVTDKRCNTDATVVTQLHYTEWPKNGRPTNTASMVRLIDTLTRMQISTGNKPIIVHCNDGVGRTGTFITLHCELERLKAEGIVDVFQRVKISRIARPGLVQNVEQYVYCLECLVQYVDGFDAYANFKESV